MSLGAVEREKEDKLMKTGRDKDKGLILEWGGVEYIRSESDRMRM